MTLPEIVLDLRIQIERLLPGWKIWARMDIYNFQFFGWKDSIRNCIHSECYDIRHIPQALTVARYMEINLKHIQNFESL